MAQPQVVPGRYQPPTPRKYFATNNAESNQAILDFSSGNFWYYLGAVILAIIIIWLATKNNFDAYTGLALPHWAPSPQVFSIVCIIALLVLAFVAARTGITKVNVETGKSWHNVAFGLELALIIIWALVFFVQRNYNAAFIVGLITLVVAIWWAWLVWNVDRLSAYLLILYIIWLLYILWVNWKARESKGVVA